MADTTTTSTTAAISNDPVQATDVGNDDKPKNPILSFICNLLQFLKLPLPQAKPNKKVQEPNSTATTATSNEGVEEEKVVDIVKFPRQQELPSLKLETEGAEPDTNPVVLWQVYAIGGFFILRWAWTRWNERRGKGGPSNEETPPPPNED